MNFYIHNTAQEVVESLSKRLMELSNSGKAVHISLSGGSTPRLLFKNLASTPYNQAVNWKNLHFWWGDERCVGPMDPESNFGEANALLFKNIDIPSNNIHRILGENEPKEEAVRFAGEMEQYVPLSNGIPQFDWILLGLGQDGHTASLFPHKTDYSESAISIVATHPDSGQIRVSKSARLIENAKCVTYLVLGESKAKVLKEIQTIPAAQLPYPAAKIKSVEGDTEWVLDLKAAQMLTQGD